MFRSQIAKKQLNCCAQAVLLEGREKMSFFLTEHSEAELKQMYFAHIDTYKKWGLSDCQIIGRLLDHVFIHKAKVAWRILRDWYELRMLLTEKAYRQEQDLLAMKVDAINQRIHKSQR